MLRPVCWLLTCLGLSTLALTCAHYPRFPLRGQGVTLWRAVVTRSGGALLLVAVEKISAVVRQLRPVDTP